MVEEPGHIKKGLDVYFTMAGVNIRISREITSLALLMNDEKYSDSITELTHYLKNAVVIFDWISLHIREPLVAKLAPDFSAIKETFESTVFSRNEKTRFIKVELEKIVFELETMCVLIKEQKQIKG
ncbi:MAG: hypothetical protein V4565_03390 [Bacteroidota bacterium]